MINWNNLDTLTSFTQLKKTKEVNLSDVMSGEAGAERVKNYNVPMACGLNYNYAAKKVDSEVLNALVKLADEAQLADKFKALYNGEVINTGEKRLVLHHMTRGQLGDAVNADGVDKRSFYKTQQERIAEFANKVHNGEITNAAGEKFTTVVQIGIGGSDLGPRAMYIALENWAKKNNAFKMEAKFISNVDPDDASAILASIDVAHSLFILVSKSGTTLETLTNESFVKDALKKAGLNPARHMIAVTSETSPLAKSSDYLDAFFMDDYIGGRFSSTSSVGGAVLSLAFGPEVFAAFLDGATAEDKLSMNSDPLKNPEMLDALIGVYERNVLGYGCTAVLPYSQGLSRFPAHLQQLDMESNGKSVNRFGEPVDYPTGPVIFGEPGTNGQHSFYQLLHQGTDIVPLHHDMDATGFGYPLGQIPRMDVLSFEADKKLIELADKACRKVLPEIGTHIGRVVSGDQFISDKAVKERIASNFNGCCTEMEGAAIAQTAYLNKVPFVILRAISDKADDSATMDYPTFEKKAIENSVKLIKELVLEL